MAPILVERVALWN